MTIPRELREGLQGKAKLTLEEETNEWRRDDRVGNSTGEGLPPSAAPAPFNFKLTDFLVPNGYLLQRNSLQWLTTPSNSSLGHNSPVHLGLLAPCFLMCLLTQ